MSRESPSLPPLQPSLELAASGPADVDPELVSLPGPPRLGKTLAALALLAGALLSFAMAFALRRDVVYALSPSEPASLGDLRTAPRAMLADHENRLVRADGLLGAAAGIRYERPFQADSFRALPVIGRVAAASSASDDAVWVEVRVPHGEESGRWEPPRSFVGRLMSFHAADLRHSGLARAIEDATRVRVGCGALLLIDGDAPQRERWTVLVAAAFVGLAAWNAVAFARLVRRFR